MIMVWIHTGGPRLPSSVPNRIDATMAANLTLAEAKETQTPHTDYITFFTATLLFTRHTRRPAIHVPLVHLHTPRHTMSWVQNTDKGYLHAQGVRAGPPTRR